MRQFKEGDTVPAGPSNPDKAVVVGKIKLFNENNLVLYKIEYNGEIFFATEDELKKASDPNQLLKHLL